MRGFEQAKFRLKFQDVDRSITAYMAPKMHRNMRVENTGKSEPNISCRVPILREGALGSLLTSSVENNPVFLLIDKCLKAIELEWYIRNFHSRN